LAAGTSFESLSAAQPHLLVWPPVVRVQDVMKSIRTCLGQPPGFVTVPDVVVAGTLVRVATGLELPQAATPTTAATPQPSNLILTAAS
jgi:hypothetical protein